MKVLASRLLSNWLDLVVLLRASGITPTPMLLSLLIPPPFPLRGSWSPTSRYLCKPGVSLGSGVSLSKGVCNNAKQAALEGRRPKDNGCASVRSVAAGAMAVLQPHVCFPALLHHEVSHTEDSSVDMSDMSICKACSHIPRQFCLTQRSSCAACFPPRMILGGN